MHLGIRPICERVSSLSGDTSDLEILIRSAGGCPKFRTTGQQLVILMLSLFNIFLFELSVERKHESTIQISVTGTLLEVSEKS